MQVVEKRTMNWLPRQSAYDEATAARDKRKAAAEEFISTQSGFADAFSGLMSNTVAEQGNLVSQAAAARLNIKI
jgi:hypothetical protein